METTEAADSADTIDRLDALLKRFTLRAEQFHVGPVCSTQRYEALPGRGFLHILRAGALTLHTERDPAGRIIDEPSLLFYPGPVEHAFHVDSDEGVDLACATLDFAGGASHPLVAALPEEIVVPLSAVSGLEASLGLLDGEIEEYRCGRRHIVDRVFEIVLLKLLRHLLDQPGHGELSPGLFGGLADPGIARALTAMHEEPGAPWSLEELARAARMSRSAFAGRFRELVGVSPHDYLVSWRIAVAKPLLRQGYSVSRVAAELGYTSSSFSRAFAQREGCSPRAWVGAVSA